MEREAPFIFMSSGALLIGSWAALGRLLGASWALLGGSWGALVRLLSALGRLLNALGRLLGALGRLSEPLGARHHFVEHFFMDFHSDLDPQSLKINDFHWFFIVCLIFAVFNISPDLLWILKPTSLHFKVILEVLEVSWAVLGRLGGRLGRPCWRSF